MSTAPIVNDGMPRTWDGQFTELLKQCRNFSTRADAHSALDRMASLAELYVADNPATDGFHTNVKELLRTSMRAYLDGDSSAFGNLLAIARFADQHEAKKGRA